VRLETWTGTLVGCAGIQSFGEVEVFCIDVCGLGWFVRRRMVWWIETVAVKWRILEAEDSARLRTFCCL
jgi:hypothetical protein